MEKFEFKGTPGPWIYSPERDTHDSIIHTKNAKEEFGYINNDNGGVIGSSEWIWIKEFDAKLIVTSPELFECLKLAVGLLENIEIIEDGEKDYFIRMARELLKKATE